MLAKAVLLGLLSHLSGASAYIPAHPTNLTSDAVGFNFTETSQINMQWYSHGEYAQHISRSLSSKDSTGISKGVMLHFSEDTVNADTPPTTTPWIALVSCDSNVTGASMETDVFTLAKSKGAVSVLLYSLTAEACVLNPLISELKLDVYQTQTRTSAQLVEYQYGQLRTSPLLNYDSQRLNDSNTDITNSIKSGFPVSEGYLVVTLAAWNATGDAVLDGTAGPTGAGYQDPPSNGAFVHHNSNSVLLMLSCLISLTLSTRGYS